MPYLAQSQGVTVNGGTFVDVNGSHHSINVVASDQRKREGIKLLLKSCVPEAIHDSGARGDLGCHPGTREKYVRSIISWGKGERNSNLEKRVFLMTGPAGAGKSAIAQTIADDIEASGKLGASFFFYRPSGWNDPKKFIPTIVYQLTTRYPAYRDCIDAIIVDDRLVLQKSMHIQFRELLVRPLRRLSNSGHGVERDTFIIVDGLDECATVEAQIQIIKLVTTSIREQTTPFFFSWKLPLTVYSEADSDIETYIRGGFEMIRARYSIPPDVAWPTEQNICHLVSQSAGLFVYPATALRYIGSGNSGLEERLYSVLQLGPTATENPFSALDQLYRLIMIQIPEGVLLTTLSLLFLIQTSMSVSVKTMYSTRPMDSVDECRSALGLSSAAFYAAISNLHSVLEVIKPQSWVPAELRFYHKSFIDFLGDKKRSQRYHLKSPEISQHCLKTLVGVMANMAATDDSFKKNGISFMPSLFFFMVLNLDGKLEQDILQQVVQIDWNYWRNTRYLFDFRAFIRKVGQRRLGM